MRKEHVADGGLEGADVTYASVFAIPFKYESVQITTVDHIRSPLSMAAQLLETGISGASLVSVLCRIL